MSKRLLLIASVFSVIFAIVPVNTTTVQSQPETGTFTLAVLPDTQKYSQFYRDIFIAQTQWIVDNHEEENIAFTVHLGDIVDSPRSEVEWDAADAAMAVMDEASVPYSILAGNHDVRSTGQWDNERNDERELYLQYFPAERHAAISTFGGLSPSGYNSYHIFNGGGQDFLVLAMDWRASMESVEWAQGILDAHPELPTILTTHQMVNVAEDGSSANFMPYGQYLWDFLVTVNDQVFMTINGHHHGVAHSILQNDFGNDVLVTLVDYQGDFQGGNGMLRLLDFDLNAGIITARAFSPWVDAIPEAERGERDALTKTDPGNQFVIEMDFAGRYDLQIAVVE